MLQFPHEIPREDTDLAPEEMPGSRRQQIVAVCRADPQKWSATWISQIDVADWNGWQSFLGNLPTETGLEDVLETSSEYGDCFRRITPDDARRPITFARAQAGVAWDTTGLPAAPTASTATPGTAFQHLGPPARGGARGRQPRFGDGAAGSRGDEP